jgi:hypothetical protein
MDVQKNPRGMDALKHRQTSTRIRLIGQDIEGWFVNELLSQFKFPECSYILQHSTVQYSTNTLSLLYSYKINPPPHFPPSSRSSSSSCIKASEISQANGRPRPAGAASGYLETHITKEKKVFIKPPSPSGREKWFVPKNRCDKTVVIGV